MVKRREFQRAYRFRFYPTPEQENLLRRTLGCARLVYNKALEARSEAWTSERHNVSYSDTSSMLTGWKKTDELSFLNDVSCVPPATGIAPYPMPSCQFDCSAVAGSAE